MHTMRLIMHTRLRKIHATGSISCLSGLRPKTRRNTVSNGSAKNAQGVFVSPRGLATIQTFLETSNLNEGGFVLIGMRESANASGGKGGVLQAVGQGGANGFHGKVEVRSEVSKMHVYINGLVEMCPHMRFQPSPKPQFRGEEI